MYLLYFWLGVTIVSNGLYHIFQKTMPGGVHPLAALAVSYATSLVTCLALLPFFPGGATARPWNWASVGLGLSIVGLEVGFLLAYRAGASLALSALISNTGVTLMLIPIGLMLFREKVSPTNWLGVALCLVGLALINRR